MEKLAELITKEVSQAFAAVGLDGAQYGRVTVSNRPDLCQYQCNGAMPAAKQYHKAPIQIAGDVAAALQNCPMFSMAQAVAPGFLNLNLSDDALSGYLSDMRADSRFGHPRGPKPADHRYRLRRPKCGQASACGASPLRHHRRKCKTDLTAFSATRSSATFIWVTGACKWA